MQGNKDKQILNFDPKIERTLCKLRKQSNQTHEISSEEVFEEVFDNIAEEGNKQKTLGEYFIPNTVRCGSLPLNDEAKSGRRDLNPQPQPWQGYASARQTGLGEGGKGKAGGDPCLE
ncbi:hypothetical protein PIB30_095751 [Stylosanthes scabra]|uniref:Uncharacterized protein n=1 Tax=Stylosanthes scabra TaxID=79078 RepID=A0ABU6SWN2_9FABA|nr:hypothetical protein [Stylosanthes scabra]